MAKLYKHPKSKFWWVQYSESGIRRRVSTKCKKVDDAQRALATIYIPLEINTKNKGVIVQVKKRIQDALIEYRDKGLLQNKRKAASTINRQQRNATNFLVYLEKEDIQFFSEVSEDTINDYIHRYLIFEKKKKDNTVYKDVQIMKTFFKWACEKGYCTVDPAVNVPNKKPAASLPKSLKKEEVEKIFATAGEPYVYIYKLMYYTGLRIQELLNVERDDIEVEKKQITIPIREGNKAKRPTFVKLNQKALEIITFLMQKQSGRFLFENSNGNQYNQGKIYTYTARLYNRLGISVKSKLHIWRHSTATHMVQAGVPLYDVSKVLRHKSIRETEIYASVSDEAIQAAVEILTL